MADRLRELLVKAVRELDQTEQDEVLGALLTGTTTSAVGHGFAQVHLAERVAAMAGDSGDLKVLPVRLPVADYERLRAWAKQHQFSMAVIVRTLVERFLDGQAETGPAGDRRPAPPADPTG